MPKNNSSQLLVTDKMNCILISRIFLLLKIIKMNLKRTFQKTENSFNKNSTNMKPSVDIFSNSSRSDDEESAFETSENYQFQTINEIHQLKSTINQLQIDREHMLMSYQTALDKQHRYCLTVVNENKILQQQNQSLRQTLDHIANENRTLMKDFENVKQHLNSLMSQNRNSCEYQNDGMKSMQLQNQLTNKQRLLAEQEEQLKQLKVKLTQILNCNEQHEAEINKLNQQNHLIKEKLETQRKKQIQIKRNYQVMLQSKEDILRKMTAHSDQQLNNQLSMKNRMINENKRQTEQYIKIIQQKDQQIRQLTEQNNNLQIQKSKNNKSISDKLNESLKQQLKQKEELIKITQSEIFNYQKKAQQSYKSYIQLKNELSRNKQQYQAIQSEKESLEHKVNQLERLCHQLQSEYQLKQSQKQSIRKQYETQLNLSKKKVEQYECMLKNLKSKVDSNLRSQEFEQQIKYYKEQSQFYKNQMEAIISERLQNFEQKNNALIEQNEKLKEQNTNYKIKMVKMTEKQKTTEKLLRSQENTRRQYSEKISVLETQLFRISLKSQQQQVDRKTQEQFKIISKQLQKVKITNSTLNTEKKQLLAEINELKRSLEEIRMQIKSSEACIRNYQTKIEEKQKQCKTAKKLLQAAQQKAKTDEKNLHKKIQDLTQLMSLENKRFEKKRIQFDQQQDSFRAQIRKYKNTLGDLQQEIERMRKKKDQNNLQLSRKVEQLSQLLSTKTKQLSTLERISQANLKNKIRQFDDEKEKLQEYAGKLQSDICYLQQQLQSLHQKNCMLTQQINMMQNEKSQYHSLEQKNYQLKTQLSEALKQINAVLKRYQSLEQKYLSITQNKDFMENKFFTLQQKYKQVCNDKNMLISELDNSYAKIQQLNANLFSINDYPFVKQHKGYSSKSFAKSQRQIQAQPQRKSFHSNQFIRPVVSPQQIHATNKTIKIPRYMSNSITTVSSTNLNNRYF